MAKKMTWTLIVDDEEDMRVLVRATIEAANDGLAVAGEAATGEDGLARWREFQPEIVILDQRMPGLSGLEVAGTILREQPGQSIVLFSAYLDTETRREAARIGIRECLSKSEIARLPEVLWRCAGTG